MRSLVERLRRKKRVLIDNDELRHELWLINPDGPEAANEIERLREALRPFASLRLPARCEGNAAAYSILHKSILAAREALSIHEGKPE